MTEPAETIPLKEYIESLLTAQREYFKSLHDAQEQRHQHHIAMLNSRVAALQELVNEKQSSLALAVEKQEKAYDIRFAGVNEWRQTFGDMANRAVTQDMFLARQDESTRRLNNIEQRLANFDGRILGYSAGVGLVVLIIAIGTQLLNIGG